MIHLKLIACMMIGTEQAKRAIKFRVDALPLCSGDPAGLVTPEDLHD
jgi:hypothetical protein